MKIKRLDPPAWVENYFSDRNDESIVHSFISVEPRFHRNGYYLVDGTVLIEYNGTAMCSKTEGSVRAFKRDFQEAEYEGINILSRDQRLAIWTLFKTGLVTDAQFSLAQNDYSRRKLNLENLKWKKAFDNDQLNP